MAINKNNQSEEAKHAFMMPDGHHRLGGSGFEKRGDYVLLAPDRITSMNVLNAQESGVRKLLDSVHEFASVQLSEIEIRRENAWRNIFSDLNIPTDMQLNYKNGRVTMLPERKSRRGR